MDVFAAVVSVVATLAAIASAWVAIVQARSAKASEGDAVLARNEARIARDESERLAGVANAAFIRQAEAQEKANALREAELIPPTWTVRFISGQLYAGTNTSGRSLVVDRFEVDPDGTERWVRVTGTESGIYTPGDSFKFVSARMMGQNPQKLTVFYRFQDEPDDDESRFIIPL